MSEGEVRIDPSLIAFAEEIIRDLLEGLLQVVYGFIDAHLVSIAEHSHCLHLVEDWVVEAINFVPAIDIPFVILEVPKTAK